MFLYLILKFPAIFITQVTTRQFGAESEKQIVTIMISEAHSSNLGAWPDCQLVSANAMRISTKPENFLHPGWGKKHSMLQPAGKASQNPPCKHIKDKQFQKHGAWGRLNNPYKKMEQKWNSRISRANFSGTKICKRKFVKRAFLGCNSKAQAKFSQEYTFTGNTDLSFLYLPPSLFLHNT